MAPHPLKVKHSNSFFLLFSSDCCYCYSNNTRSSFLQSAKRLIWSKRISITRGHVSSLIFKNKKWLILLSHFVKLSGWVKSVTKMVPVSCKNKESCYICSIRLKGLSVKYEKYGTLSFYLCFLIIFCRCYKVQDVNKSHRFCDDLHIFKMFFFQGLHHDHPKSFPEIHRTSQLALVHDHPKDQALDWSKFNGRASSIEWWKGFFPLCCRL